MPPIRVGEMQEMFPMNERLLEEKSHHVGGALVLTTLYEVCSFTVCALIVATAK